MLLHAVGVVMQSQQAEGDRGRLTCCPGLNISFRICKSLELTPDIHKSDLPPWPKIWSWYLVCPELSWEQQWSQEAGRNGGRQAVSWRQWVCSGVRSGLSLLQTKQPEIPSLKSWLNHPVMEKVNISKSPDRCL